MILILSLVLMLYIVMKILTIWNMITIYVLLYYRPLTKVLNTLLSTLVDVLMLIWLQINNNVKKLYTNYLKSK